jgi:ABC-2 type transport system ATP-binding protein
MLQPAIRADRLTRYFGKRPIIRDLDFQIPTGQVTALLGLNGAGKTTTIRIIMGLLRPTRGHCEILGHESSTLSPDSRMRIGYLVEGHYLYPRMSVRECASFQRAGYSRWDDRLFDDIIGHFGIPGSGGIHELSRGQRAGVALALVLAPDPELLVLDDPALGLDPVSRQRLNETLIEFAAGGKRTVLLSTHLLDDVERIADRVMLMVAGQLKVDAGLDDFRRRVSGYSAEIESVDPQRLAVIPGLIDARQLGGRLQLSIVDADQETRAALDRLNATSLEQTELTFSDCVLAYLGRERSEASFLNSQLAGANP